MRCNFQGSTLVEFIITLAVVSASLVFFTITWADIQRSYAQLNQARITLQNSDNH